MENATKALLMAGGVLIALMILALLLFMFTNIQNFESTGTQNQREAQVVEFNNQYEPYNRNDVRGSDLYSLLNKVVDYNRRKSTVGNVGTDQGQYLAYKPMTITFKVHNKNLNKNGDNYLFKKEDYTVDNRTNDFENVIKEKITELENKSGYKESELQNLCKSINEIFVDVSKETDNNEIIKKKFNAVTAYNSCCKAKLSTKSSDLNNSFKTIQDKKTDIYNYYEYVQFKRVIFKCTKVKYNDKTGRIIEMNFEDTGKIN